MGKKGGARAVPAAGTIIITATGDLSLSHPTPSKLRRTVGGLSTRMSACPSTAELDFLSRPPNPMYAMQDYPTDYRFVLDSAALFHVPAGASATNPETWHIPHANIHSCFSTVGFCTPFVGNTPGLRCACAVLLTIKSTASSFLPRHPPLLSPSLSHNAARTPPRS